MLHLPQDGPTPNSQEADSEVSSPKESILRSLAKKLIASVVRNNVTWAVLNNAIVRPGVFARTQRAGFEIERQFGSTRNTLMKIAPGLVVQHGPFKGMKYPGVNSVGSALIPKLLGSYERELHPLIDSICAGQYDQVVDIGCAEGYYAVGLAMR